VTYYYFFINLTFIISGYVLGLILFAVPLPDTDILKGYRLSSKILGASYILLSIFNTAVLFLDLTDYTPEYLRFSGLLISSSQSLIFAFTLIILLIPNKSRKITIKFKIHALTILLFLTGYVLLSLFQNDPILSTIPDLDFTILQPFTILRITFFVFYLFQIVEYCVIFNKAIRNYNRSIDSFLSESGTIKLNWIKFSFFSALSIGLMAIIYQTFPSILFDNFFTTVLVVFYTVFAIKFINYNKSYQKEEITLNETTKSYNMGHNTLSDFINTK
jgi:hypothetical protein